jgi:4-amino-4-deoxy-L-arabinose transferase-like glycosyltransferase
MALGYLEPNLVAHSSLVTTDMGLTLFIVLTVYLLWEYRRTQMKGRHVYGLESSLLLI